MVAFLFGILTGFVVGYAIGVWAGWYTDKELNKYDNR